MRRRTVVGSLIGGALLGPTAGRGQPSRRPHRIGWLGFQSRDAPLTRTLLGAFWDGMHALGYVEGRTVIVDYRFAGGEIGAFSLLAADLVHAEVDLIVAGNTAAVRAAASASTSIPIVCFNLGDPIGEGLATSLARPGGNVTGMTILAPELVPKGLVLLKQAAPATSRVAALWQPGVLTQSGSNEMLERARSAARALNVALLPFSARDKNTLEEALRKIGQARIEALHILPSPLSLFERQRLIDFANSNRLPTMGWIREFVDIGGLLSYGVDFNAQYQRGAYYVDRILKGAEPGDLPIEQPTRFEFVINAKTANALALTIPPTVLAFADEVIE